MDYDRQRGLLSVNVKNRFAVGDVLELMTPQGNVTFTLGHLESLQGETLAVAPGAGWQVRVPAPVDINPEFALLMRCDR
jgi:putative protease